MLNNHRVDRWVVSSFYKVEKHLGRFIDGQGCFAKLGGRRRDSTYARATRFRSELGRATGRALPTSNAARRCAWWRVTDTIATTRFASADVDRIESPMALRTC